MQLVIDRFFLPTFHLPPIDDISISNSISSVSPLPHLDRRAIGTTAVAAVTCRTIGLLLPVPPVLLEVLPSRYLALARSSIVDWMWVEEGNKVRKHTTCHPVIDSAVVLDVSPSSCCSTPRSSESICRGDFRTIEWPEAASCVSRDCVMLARPSRYIIDTDRWK